MDKNITEFQDALKRAATELFVRVPAGAVKVDLINGIIAVVGSVKDIRTLLESENDISN